MYLYLKNIGFIKCFEVWNLVNFNLDFCSVQAITASFCNRKNIWIWDGKSLIALPYPMWKNWTLYIFIVLISHRYDCVVLSYKLNRSPPRDHPKTFLLKALCCLLWGGGWVVGGPGHFTVSTGTGRSFDSRFSILDSWFLILYSIPRSQVPGPKSQVPVPVAWQKFWWIKTFIL